MASSLSSAPTATPITTTSVVVIITITIIIIVVVTSLSSSSRSPSPSSSSWSSHHRHHRSRYSDHHLHAGALLRSGAFGDVYNILARDTREHAIAYGMASLPANDNTHARTHAHHTHAHLNTHTRLNAHTRHCIRVLSSKPIVTVTIVTSDAHIYSTHITRTCTTHMCTALRRRTCQQAHIHARTHATNW